MVSNGTFEFDIFFTIFDVQVRQTNGVRWLTTFATKKRFELENQIGGSHQSKVDWLLVGHRGTTP